MESTETMETAETDRRDKTDETIPTVETGEASTEATPEEGVGVDTMPTESKLRYAFLHSLPVMFGYIFLGIAFGIVSEEAGYGVLWAGLLSVLVYAGSLQFVMVPLMAAAVSPVTMAVTALFVNFRHIFYGFSFVESFRKMKQEPYMIFALTDETYSVLCGCRNEDPKEEMRDTWFLITLFDQCYWVLGSVIGAIIGHALPLDFTGIEFSMTALFVVILLEQVLHDVPGTAPAAIAGLGISLLCVRLFGVNRFLLPALLLSVFFVALYSQSRELRDKAPMRRCVEGQIDESKSGKMTAKEKGAHHE